MASHRSATFEDVPYVEPNPLPSSIPKVDEIGATSAPLKSASFAIGEYCKEVNEDFMLCKQESRDPAHCLKEGRKVTRCAQELIRKIRDNCNAEFEKHWQCLEKNNQYFQACRTQETALNSCLADKLASIAFLTRFSYTFADKINYASSPCLDHLQGLKKTIPGSPEGQVPVHEKARPIFTRVQK